MTNADLTPETLRAAALILMAQPGDLNSSVRESDPALETASSLSPERLEGTVDEALLERRLSDVLREARVSQGLTGTEAGALLGVGRSRISRIEHEADRLELGNLIRYAAALGYGVRLELVPEAGGEALVARLS